MGKPYVPYIPHSLDVRQAEECFSFGHDLGRELLVLAKVALLIAEVLKSRKLVRSCDGGRLLRRSLVNASNAFMPRSRSNPDHIARQSVTERLISQDSLASL